MIGFKLISPISPGEMRAGKNGHACCFVKLGFGSDFGTEKGNKIQGKGSFLKELRVCSQVDRLKRIKH